METVDYIERALSTGQGLMSIYNFIRMTQYPINNFRIDTFRNTIEDGMPMYIDDTIIKWFGYADTTPQQRRSAFLHDLYTLKPVPIINTDFYYLDNKQYTTFITNTPLAKRTYYPLNITQVDDSNEHLAAKCMPQTNVEDIPRQRYYLLLTPQCLERLMISRTYNNINRYYYDLKELFKVYRIYMREHRARKHSHADEQDYIIIKDTDTCARTSRHTYDCGLDMDITR